MQRGLTVILVPEVARLLLTLGFSHPELHPDVRRSFQTAVLTLQQAFRQVVATVTETTSATRVIAIFDRAEPDAFGFLPEDERPHLARQLSEPLPNVARA